jgi:hypothetical protein
VIERSDRILAATRAAPSLRRRSGPGQSLVEFALVLPVLLLIVLFALDFGRAYMGWITINGMARTGANFAAQHPDAWGTPGDPDARAQYLDLMTRSRGALDCALAPLPDPVFPEGRKVGKPAEVHIDCDFRPAAPMISAIVGDPVRVSASSAFPIMYGCLAGCPPPPPDTTPPPPVSNCREIPTLVGMSVAGAKAAWVQAGFLIENVNEPGGAIATDTVATATVTPPPDAEFCPSGEAFFSASVSITVQAPGERTSDTCVTLPNVRGMSVGAARTAWGSSGFVGTFTPATDFDTSVVIEQTATPTADPGDCVEPDTSLAVAYGAPPPAPPPPPCKVPSFVNTSTTTASATWTTAGFAGANLTFRHRTPYTIKSQSLVGGTWVSCGSAIELSRN